MGTSMSMTIICIRGVYSGRISIRWVCMVVLHGGVAHGKCIPGKQSLDTRSNDFAFHRLISTSFELFTARLLSPDLFFS